MHILLIEDDPRLSEYLQNSLGREGFTIDVCSNLIEAETYMLSTKNELPRVVILDRMLGHDDGATLIPKLNLRYPETSILILSSLDMPSEKARIINLGADEYLAKPFSLEELSARLRLVTRRRKLPTDSREITMLKLGNLVINLSTQTANVGAKKLDLTRKEMQVLSLLLESPGRVFNRFQLLDRVWEIERTTESNVVEATIKNLRRKMEETACSARIESKRGLGYWIEA